MIPLTLCKIGEENQVVKLSGNDATKRHLENLGFNVGSYVTIINTLNDNLIVKVKEARIALSVDLAIKIMVN